MLQHLLGPYFRTQLKTVAFEGFLKNVFIPMFPTHHISFTDLRTLSYLTISSP